MRSEQERKRRKKQQIQAVVIVAVLGISALGASNLISQLNQFETYQQNLQLKRYALQQQYATFGVLKKYRMRFNENLKGVSANVAYLKRDKKKLDLPAMASLAEVLDAKQFDQTPPSSPNLYAALFKVNTQQLADDISTFKTAIAEYYDIKVLWERYRSMEALRKHLNEQASLR